MSFPEDTKGPVAKDPLSYEQFRTSHLEPIKTSELPPESDCPVCYEKFDGDRIPTRILVPPCTHVFCNVCIHQVCARRSKQRNANCCPICRTTWYHGEWVSQQTEENQLRINQRNFESLKNGAVGVQAQERLRQMEEAMGEGKFMRNNRIGSFANPHKSP
ncbi:hypothetical protein BS50DRAFT_657941 [Corynespora cassiicola Philippines]|uniref:RING-type domain-containing protein n=1 Tax=Corynespora cassiicola Philippines TaxID=1448308 RepID=A0A2T2P370_CORCC|nr:hypothetical protein BS50DRAFT_657941 [Corynespora cassiicola Philippines]